MTGIHWPAAAENLPGGLVCLLSARKFRWTKTKLVHRQARGAGGYRLL